MGKNTIVPRVRPRFELNVKWSKEEPLSRISDRLKKSKDGIEGVIVDNHVILDIPEKYRHFWSPQMNFRFVKENDNSTDTIVRGIIGPRPAVWTLFVFFYFAIGVIGFLISSYGLSKWSLGSYSHTIWAFPISILIMLTAYFAGKFGERLGQDQVMVLKQFVGETLSL